MALDGNQDWTLVEGKMSCGVTYCFYMCAVERLLTTDDEQDYEFSGTGKVRGGFRFFTSNVSTSAFEK